MRYTLKWFGRLFPFLFPKKDEVSEEDYIKTMPTKIQRKARKEGLDAFMSRRALLDGYTVTRLHGR